jgi:hypothetical protein
VEALLEVTAHPDADIFTMAFPFWYKLSKWLRQSDSRPSRSGSLASSGSTTNMTDAAAANGGGEGGGAQLPGPPPVSPAEAAAAEAERARQRQFFAPAFEKLLTTARSRMRWVSGRVGNWQTPTTPVLSTDVLTYGKQINLQPHQTRPRPP